MRVSAAGNMPLQGLVKPPAKPVVMIIGMKRIERNAFAQNNRKRNGGIRMSMNSGKRNLASGAAEVEQ